MYVFPYVNVLRLHGVVKSVIGPRRGLRGTTPATPPGVLNQS
jgi:hypothetical protein